MAIFLLPLFWVTAVLPFTFLLFLPVSTEGQVLLGLSSCALLFAIRELRLTGVWRSIFFSIGFVLVLRYVYWRVTRTLPPPDDIPSFIPALLLLAAELYSVLMLGLNLFVAADPVERPGAPLVDDDDAPSVDVFVPSYNEELELIGVTLAAARAMDYPAARFAIYLLDDGGTDEKCASTDPLVARDARTRRAALQRLCADLGVHYLTRPRNERAKAGNLNAALRRTHGELVLVLDADHAPAREFLRQTVGFFRKDDRLFLVQTPHFFLNPDPLERNLRTFSEMPSENEMFYGAVQKGLDKWNAAFFCGSAAVLRRSALDEVGGFSGTTITEDAETALDLHARGWRSLYVDRPMIAGLQPETFEAFIGQRSRWCRGMLQILILKQPLFRPGLSAAQRICYGSSTLFWLFPLARLTFVVAPLLYVFFGLKIVVAELQDFVAYTALYLAGSMLLQSYCFGRLRWPWVSELYEYVQSVHLFTAVLGVFANPRAPKFNVTAKGETIQDTRLSYLAWPYVGLFGLLLGAMAVIAQRYVDEPNQHGILAVVAVWNFFNLVVAGAALGVVLEQRERRRDQRIGVRCPGELLLGEEVHPVLIEDVSYGGLALRPVTGPLEPALGIRSGLLRLRSGREGGGDIEVPVRLGTARTDEAGRLHGVRFTGTTTAQFSAVADLIFADMSMLRGLREARRKHRGVLQSTLQLLAWGARHSLRALLFAARSTPPTAAPNAEPGARAVAPAE